MKTKTTIYWLQVRVDANPPRDDPMNNINDTIESTTKDL